MKNQSVIILACNIKKYVDFALNLAESIKLHNPGLLVFIVTNLGFKQNIPGVKFIPIREDWAKLYIEAKIYIDHFLQTEETLFIDSDCLCFASLEPVFKACHGMDVTVVGRLIPLENYWGITGAAFARKEFLIDKSILFNGGFYYLKKTLLTKSIFNKAREIAAKYDDYGFSRIKNNLKNEEDLLSIGMIANKQYPIDDNGNFFTDLATDIRPKILNVIKGERLLRNPGNSWSKPRSWYPSTYAPIILHFGGSNIKSYPYISQSLLLKLHKKGFSIPVSSFIVYLFIHIPYRSYHLIRELLGLNKYNG